MSAYEKTTKPPITYVPVSENVHLNGWNASVTENLNHWIGGTLDFTGGYGSTQPLGSQNQVHAYTFLYGPRVFRQFKSMTPFAQALFGGTHVNVNVTQQGPQTSDTSFALAAGGGLDWKLGARIAARVIQADYFRTNSFGAGHNEIRVSVGVIVLLGEKK